MEDNGHFIKSLFVRFAIPAIVTLLGFMSNTLVLGIIAGHYFASEGLAVISVCTPVLTFFMAAGSLIGVGGSNCANQYVARDDYEGVNSLYSVALCMVILLAALVLVPGLVFKDAIVSALADGALILSVRGYYTYIVLFGVLTMLTYVLGNFARIDGKPRVSMYMFISMPIISAGTGYLFINRLGMGIEGLALALSAAMGAACIIGAFFIAYKRRSIRLTVPNDIIKHVKNTVSAGSPTALNNFCTLIRTFILNTLLMSISGGEAVAAFSVLTVASTFAIAFLLGVGQALIPLAGVFNEEKDYTSLIQTMKRAFTVGGVCSLFLAAGFILLRSNICSLFGITQAATADMLKAALICLAAGLPFSLFNTLFIAYYNATLNIKLANIITTLRSFVFVVAIAYSLCAPLGVNAVWLSFPLSEALALVSILFISGVYRAKNKSLTPLLMLDRVMERENRYVSFSVDNNQEAVSRASARIAEFCEAQDMPPKRAMLLSMSVDEMLTLIIKYSLNNRENSAAVRLFIAEKETILRIRYTGKKFNPLTYYEKQISGDIEKSLEVIGIKYIMKVSKAVYYRETFGVNNLVITI